MTLDEFDENVRELADVLLARVRDEKGILPMVHFLTANGVEGLGLDPVFFEAGQDRALLHNALLPYIEVFHPTAVGWSFLAWHHGEGGLYHHEALVVVIVDPEIARVHEARVVRHDGQASRGAWRPWPVAAAIGPLITPIQEALR